MQDTAIVGEWLSYINEIASNAPYGDFVECGVYNGASAMQLAQNCKTTLHLFDSWEGISDLKDDDNDFYKNNQWITDIKNSQEYLKKFNNIKYYKGWFPDRFDDIKNVNISLLHIDASLYYPTKLSLEYMWDKIIPGGYVICNFHDDYSTGPKKAFYEFFKNTKNVIEYPKGIRLIIKNK